MKTYILRWNPAISSFSLESFRHIFCDDFYDIRTELPVEMNWSIYQWSGLAPGDEFFMFTTGSDSESELVMYGVFTTKPYKMENWREGSGRIMVHYADFDCLAAFAPNTWNAIPVSEIRASIPDYDFGHGHSGMLLDENIAKELKRIVDEKRESLFRSKLWEERYTPRNLPSTLEIPLSEERQYISSSRKKLIEGIRPVCDYYGNPYQFAVAVDSSRLWDTLWAIVERAFANESFSLEIEVVDYRTLLVEKGMSVSELASRLKPYENIIVNDTSISLSFEGKRIREVILTEEKEILVRFGRKPDTQKFLEGLGFEKRKDFLLFYDNMIIKRSRSSVFGEEFDDATYYEIKQVLEAEYSDRD